MVQVQLASGDGESGVGAGTCPQTGWNIAQKHQVMSMGGSRAAHERRRIKSWYGSGQSRIPWYCSLQRAFNLFFSILYLTFPHLKFPPLPSPLTPGHYLFHCLCLYLGLRPKLCAWDQMDMGRERGAGKDPKLQKQKPPFDPIP